MSELKKILLVEDELRLQKITRLALQKFGKFEVEVSATGPETLETAPIFKPDLILLDVRIPGMDGPSTLVELRKTDECRDTPVVFVTASVSEQDRDRYHELGALDVIEKPYEPMELAERLKTLWARRNP